MTLRAAPYIRVSTDEQAKSGYSVADQLRQLRAHCEAHGYEIVEEIIDDGYSGASMDRPGLAQVYGLAKDRAIDIVLATKRDRLFRKQLFRLQADEDLKKHKVRFVAINDTGNKIGDSVLDSYAEWERDNLIERSRDGKNEKALQGKIINHNNVAYGFRYAHDKSSYVPDKNMATVRRIFKMIYEGRSIQAVKKILDSEGVPTPGNSKFWNPITIRRILLNDLYKPFTVAEIKDKIGADVGGSCGNSSYGIWYRCKGTEDEVAVPVPHEGESEYGDVGIPREHVEHARNYLKTTHRWREGKTDRFFELRGLIYCGACGGSMTPTHNSGYYYYSCIKRRNHGKKACPESHNQRASDAEKKVLEFVDTQILSSPELVAEKIDAAIEEEVTKLRNPGEEATTWLRVIERCDRNEAADQEMYHEGALKMDVLKSNIAAYEVQREQAREKIAESRAGQERIEQLRATKQAMLEVFASGLLYDGLEYFSEELRHAVYQAMGLKVTVYSEDSPYPSRPRGRIEHELWVTPRLVRLTREIQDYNQEVAEYRDKLIVHTKSNSIHPGKLQRWLPLSSPGILCSSTTPAFNSPLPLSSASCCSENR